MNESFKFHILLLLLLLLLAILFAARFKGESSTCVMVYKEGGAPAVLQSPKCPRWTLSNYGSIITTTSSSTASCQSTILQGRRKSQEDRILCALDIRIPFPASKMGVKEVTVGIMAVFDGHDGAEASGMAPKLLLEYFILHTYFLLDSTYFSVTSVLVRWSYIVNGIAYMLSNHIFSMKVVLERETEISQQVVDYISSVMNTQFVKNNLLQHYCYQHNKWLKSHMDLVREGGKWLKSTSNSCSVVTTLITTVVFLASTAVPGGINDSSGMPILKDFRGYVPRKLLLGLTLLFVSPGSMLISFCAGQFFLLKSKLKDMALPVYTMICLPIILLSIAQFPPYFQLLKVTFKKFPPPGFKFRWFLSRVFRLHSTTLCWIGDFTFSVVRVLWFLHGAILLDNHALT
uniref:PGG domain-containing protein n=1 Tax=Quercus lobata TaxID=97700 RepID=A0A7N2N705_QUELO